jgi:protease-4
MQFLRTLLATVVGIGVFFFFAFLLLLGIASSAGGDKTVKVEENSILRVSLSEPVVEWVDQTSPFDGLPFPGFSDNTPIGLIELRDALQQAKVDPKIKGILLEPSSLSTGLAIQQEIREALLDFKTSGKFIVANSIYYSENAYLMASVADEIYLHPQGTLEFDGYSLEFVSVKGMLDKIGVKAEVFKAGSFKSAVEPFIQNKMSPENRLQNQVMIDSLYQFYLSRVGSSRNIDAKILKEISDEAAILLPADAIKTKLITDTLYIDQIEEKLREKIGIEPKAKINYISLKRYTKAERAEPLKFSSNKIAVLVAEGEITRASSMGETGTITAEKLVKDIRKVKEDKSVKAVVLRINSPGGDGVISDMIWRELLELKKEKPLYASMSDYAASGGYYLAMACDTIVAQPSTLTGSIGVFILFFNPKELLTNKIGLNFEKISTGQYSDYPSAGADLTEAERKMIQVRVDQVYGDFVRKAAQGRNMTVEELNKIAEGRVWTGMDAHRLGLVDQLGSYQDAISLAAQRAGIEDDYQVTVYPRKKDIFAALFDQSANTAAESMMRYRFGDLYPLVQEIKSLNRLQGGPQALLPFLPVIK